MKRRDVPNDLSGLAFDFFYWFSQMEFALKENGYLASHASGASAKPGWNDFSTQFHHEYLPAHEARWLLEATPKRQMVADNGELEWKDVAFTDGESDLGRVIQLLNVVRNNLFHGGKHGSGGWDDSSRSCELLRNGIIVIRQLAALGHLEADLTQTY